jgi:hypothetical protein
MEARPPRQIDDAIPREAERICLKALSKRATDRYPTARDMADDLRHFLAEASAASASGAQPLPPRRPGPVLDVEQDSAPSGALPLVLALVGFVLPPAIIVASILAEQVLDKRPSDSVARLALGITRAGLLFWLVAGTVLIMLALRGCGGLPRSGRDPEQFRRGLLIRHPPLVVVGRYTRCPLE